GRIVGGRLRSERCSGGEVLDPRREGADRLAVHSRAGGGVDRHLRVGDRVVCGREDAEGEAVGTQVEVRGRRRGHGALHSVRREDDLAQCLSLRRGEQARAGRGATAAARAVVRAAAAGDEREGDHGGGEDEGLAGHGRHRSWGTDRVTGAIEASLKEETLAEKAALITGGSSGIGLAIARMLGEDGYGLTVSARRPDKLEAAAEDLRSGGLDVQSVAANMADEENLTALVA